MYEQFYPLDWCTGLSSLFFVNFQDKLYIYWNVSVNYSLAFMYMYLFFVYEILVIDLCLVILVAMAQENKRASTCQGIGIVKSFLPLSKPNISLCA